MKSTQSPEIRARDLRRAVGARMHLVHWDAGIEPQNEWISASVDSPARLDHFCRWLDSKKIDASCEFVRFDSFSNTLQKFSWREIVENPKLIFVGDSWKMVSHDLRWIFDFMRGSVRFGALKEEPIQPPQTTPGSCAPLRV
jgi:hypothetical protein